MQEEHCGKPYIFEDIINYLINKETPKKREKKEILALILKHIKLEIEEKGEYTGIREMRKHIAWYTKGLENGTELRNKVNQITNQKELIEVLSEYFN